VREMTGEQRCLIHSANRSLEWWDAVGGNVLERVKAGAMGNTSPVGKRKRGFPLMHAAGEKSACGMTVRGWAQAQAYAVRFRERHAASPTLSVSFPTTEI